MIIKDRLRIGELEASNEELMNKLDDWDSSAPLEELRVKVTTYRSLHSALIP